MGHPFFPDRPVDEARSQWQLQQGGLPLRAQRRIEELRASPRPVFTSTLTTSELVAARASGVTPLSQVMGSSIFHVGFRGFTSWVTGELVSLTAAYDRARSLALSRMQQEAAMLGAHMVIDVRFLGRGYDWADDLVEFTAVGTAVRIADRPPPPQPVLTLLTSDELVKLRHAGYEPVAIAMGNCFFYARHADCASEGSFWSSELPVHTQGSQLARDLSVQRFHAFAQHFHTDGVVGVRVIRRARDHEWESNDTKHTSFHVDMLVMGTAVTRTAPASTMKAPQILVDLRDIKTRYGMHG